METSNPALQSERFRAIRNEAVMGEPMSISGTINKSFILIALVLLAASWSWASPERIAPWILPGSIISFILSLVIIFRPSTAPLLAPVYALGEGIFLGAISSIFEVRYPGIATQAVLCTMGTFFAMLVAYRTGIIRATEGFRNGILIATGGIAFAYLMDIILSFFGIHMPFIHSTGPFGIVVSLVITGVAALNLILDFDMIERNAQMKVPKYVEWYSAFGLLITLVWLYLEILRLISKVRDR